MGEADGEDRVLIPAESIEALPRGGVRPLTSPHGHQIPDVAPTAHTPRDAGHDH